MANANAFLSAQVISTVDEIVNESGKALPTADARDTRQETSSTSGALVQVLTVGPDQTIYPPATDGTPHESNTVLYETEIGTGIYPDGNHFGQFSSAITPRPADGTKLFVRIFNAPTLEASSFYSDSEVYTVTWLKNSVHWVNIEATDTPLDTADNDTDGLINSWEKSLGSSSESGDSDGDGLGDLEEAQSGSNPIAWDSDSDGLTDPEELALGTDPTSPDSDADGMTDPDELLTGTCPTNNASYLSLDMSDLSQDGSLVFSWLSTTGLIYQVQCAISNSASFEPLTPELPGTEGSMHTPVYDVLTLSEFQWFRLKVNKP